jgi:hypothetical protein
MIPSDIIVLPINMMVRAPRGANKGLTGVKRFKHTIRVEPTPISSTVVALSFRIVVAYALEKTPD